MSSDVCPCGSKQLYQLCCGKFISREQTPPTAAELMRSRYSAFCLGKVDYLIATHAPSKRKFDDRIQLTQTVKHTQWLGLNIIDTERGRADDQVGYVEFVAVYQTDKHPQQLHERSKFIKIEGNWFYLHGDILPALTPKRNEPCWCGSGKKFKKCHGQ